MWLNCSATAGCICVRGLISARSYFSWLLLFPRQLVVPLPAGRADRTQIAEGARTRASGLIHPERPEVNVVMGVRGRERQDVRDRVVSVAREVTSSRPDSPGSALVEGGA